MAINQYLLQWNQHMENFAENFSILRDQSQYVDCTLACEDGIVSAHRIVLAGCSTYFQDLFARTATPHPVIFLTNTHRSIILLLLEFIYRGKAYVPQEKLGELLEIGRQLRVKGLIRVNSPNIDALVGSISENLSKTMNIIPTATAVHEPILTNSSVHQSPSETSSCNEIAESVSRANPIGMKLELPNSPIVDDSDETMSAVNGEMDQLEKNLINEIALTSQRPDKVRKRGRPRINSNYMRFKNKRIRAKSRLGTSTGYCLSSLDILTLGGYSKKFGAQETIKFAWKKHKRNFRPATIIRYEGLFSLTAEKKRQQIEKSLDDFSKE